MDFVKSVPVPCNDSDDSILEDDSFDDVEDDTVGNEIVEFKATPNEELTLLLEEHHPWSFSDDDFHSSGVKRQRRSSEDDFHPDAKIMQL